MVELDANTVSQDPLSEFSAQQRGPLMARQEWLFLQNLDALRSKFDGFLGALNDEEKREYVRLQKAWIDAQKALEQSISELTEAFEHQALTSLRTELKTLTGQDIDPTVTKIHTRYLRPSNRVRRAAHEEQGEGGVKISSVTLWSAACLNYDGLTGWSYPGRTGLADASFLDRDINTTAGEFIALVRRLDLGRQLRKELEQALRPSGSLGNGIMALASAELDFALIDALKNAATSRIDRDKYLYVKRALAGEARWGRLEEMVLFIPDGVDSGSWIPQSMGLIGQYVGPPPGDSLSIPHLVFSVSECKGAFSFFPNRPGGSLRHHDSHRKACEEFHVAFHAFYKRGHVDWLYQVMLLRDCARLKKLVKTTPPPRNLEGFAKVIHSLAQNIPVRDLAGSIGYVRNSVQKTPVVSLNDYYIKRCRANVQELANETPGFMPTMIELFQTVFSEILNVLLIPVPGALRGLGRARMFAMFVALEQGLVEGAYRVNQGEPGELLQGFVDLADLLISGRMHTRLAKSVQRRHQRLYQQLSQQRSATPESHTLTNPQLLEKMLGSQDAPARELEMLLDASTTSREALNQVWEGAAPSASLVEAAQRFKVDQLIDWVAEGADPSRPAPVGSVEVMAPLLTQLEGWPVDTALSIENHQGQEVRRYSKDVTRPTTDVVTVNTLENYQFAYATPRRLTAHLPVAIAALLPANFPEGAQALLQQLALQAKARRIDLFSALTRFAEVSRSAASQASASLVALLPDRVSLDPPVSAVMTQLHALHPDLSQVRLLEVLRRHPLSEHQQTQLLHSQLQPEALYNALRAARQVARRESIVDGLYHSRRFNRQTQNWAADLAQGVLLDLTGQALVVSPAEQAVPYVSRGNGDRTVVVIDQLRGRFAPFYHGESRTGATLTGADSFFETIVNQLSQNDLLRLGSSVQRAITEFRYRVAQAMLRNRALDGSFYPHRREITQYASSVDTSRIAKDPDALGLYRLGVDRYLFIDSTHYKVDQAGPLAPWRIQHPSLDDGYAPMLTHNGAGAWRHEWENPLTWDGQKPFYRLGPWVRELSPDAIEQIQHISGVTPDVLRRMHVGNERPPVMLVETVERFKIHQRVKAGVEVGQDFYDELLGEIGTEKADVLVGTAGASRVDQITVLESKVEIDRPQMERLFFKALTYKSKLSPDPMAQVLQRAFPGVTARIAENLIHNVTASEHQALLNGRVPFRLSQDVRWWLDDLRKTRAIEGMYLPAAMSEDSAKLMLHTLADMDGWPRYLRVEVWDAGRLVDSIGPVDAALKRVLEPVAGHYQAYLSQARDGRQATGSPGAFLTVLLDALPAPERQALGYTDANGITELIDEIDDRLVRKRGFADAVLELGRHPWFNLPRRLADGRIGYPLSGGDVLGPVDRAQLARLRELFPVKTDQQALDLLENLSDSVRGRHEAIESFFKERAALNAVLERWTTQGEDEGRAGRSEAAERIRRCWRHEDSIRGVPYELNLDELALEDLPQMPAYFPHVRILSFRENQLRVVPASFFRAFPKLRWLSVQGNQLEHVPSGLAELKNLSLLNLENNRIKPNLGDVEHLAELTRLTKLNLSGNPLGRGARLNLYAMKALKVLILRDAGLDLLPLGAVTLRKLEVFALQNNRITVLTPYDLSTNQTVHRALDLSGNPLSQASHELLESYRRQPGYHDVDFGFSQESLLPAPFIDRWLPTLPLSEEPQRRAAWSWLVAQQMAERFFNVISSISAYRPLIATEHNELRIDITRRVWGVIDSAVNNIELRQILFTAPLPYRAGGIDGWLLCINELELQMLPVQMLADDVENAAPNFLNYYRARRRLHSIHERVSEALSVHPQRTNRELCRHIFDYRMALAEALDLPLPFYQRFDVPAALTAPYSTSMLRHLIVAEELQIHWPDLLKDEEHWIEFLERKYPSTFAAALSDFDQTLEKLTEDVNKATISEYSYRVAVDALAVSMHEAKERVVLQLTEQEWARFVSG